MHCLAESFSDVKTEWLVAPFGRTFGFLVAQMVKMPATRETWVGSLGWDDPLEEGNGYPLQYSGLEKSTDRGAWQATVHEVAESTWLSLFLAGQGIWGQKEIRIKYTEFNSESNLIPSDIHRKGPSRKQLHHPEAQNNILGQKDSFAVGYNVGKSGINRAGCKVRKEVDAVTGEKPFPPVTV